MENEKVGMNSRDAEAEEHRIAMDEIYSKLPDNKDALLEMLAKADADYEDALNITEKQERVTKFNEAQDRKTAIARKLTSLGHDFNA